MGESNVPIGFMVVPAAEERRPKLTHIVNLILFVHQNLLSIKGNILLPFFKNVMTFYKFLNYKDNANTTFIKIVGLLREKIQFK